EVLQSPTSLPAWGSVRHIVPPHWPETIGPQYWARWASVPKLAISSAAPSVRPAYIWKLVFEPLISSLASAWSVSGASWPPYCDSTDSTAQPASCNFFQASLKPVG